MNRGEAFDRMSALLSEVQIELMSRKWDGERDDLRERGAQLTADLTQAIFNYAASREGEWWR